MDAITLYEMSVSGLWLMMAGGFIWLLFQDDDWIINRDKSLLQQLENRYYKGEISLGEFKDIRKTLLSKH